MVYITSIPIIKPNIYTHQYSEGGLSTLTKTVIYKPYFMSTVRFMQERKSKMRRLLGLPVPRSTTRAPCILCSSAPSTKEQRVSPCLMEARINKNTSYSKESRVLRAMRQLVPQNYCTSGLSVGHSKSFAVHSSACEIFSKKLHAHLH